jgi:hypothetical protein
MKAAFRLGWSGAGRAIGRLLARHGRCGPPAVGWRRTGGPWFGNQLMTLTLRGRSARLRLERAQARTAAPEGGTRGGGRLETVLETRLSG